MSGRAACRSGERAPDRRPSISRPHRHRGQNMSLLDVVPPPAGSVMLKTDGSPRPCQSSTNHVKAVDTAIEPL
jgi:hypothetical protein